MYQSPSGNLESRFKAMSIERDNFMDSQYSRPSVQTSASPTWRRRASPPYPERASTSYGPLYRASQPTPADASSMWRARSQDRYSRAAPLESFAAPPSSWNARPPQPYASHRESARRSDESREHRHHSHRRRASADDDDDDDDDDDSEDSEYGYVQSSSRHPHRSSSSARKKKSRSSDSRRQRGASKHRDPAPHRSSRPRTQRHAAQNEYGDDDDDDDDDDEVVTPRAYPEPAAPAVRYVGANNRPGAARPSAERPAVLRGHTHTEAPPPTSPLGQSTLLKLVEQQQQQSRAQAQRSSQALSPWDVNGATPPSATVSNPALAPLPTAASQPSQLLEAIVHNMAFYRRCAAPAFIPPEVSLAFDEYLARGTSLLKFTKSGPPHHRFFSVRFLDLSHVKGAFERTSRTYGDRVDQQSRPACGLPEAVFCYYSNSHSKVIRRYFPLSDLVQVIGNGDGHPFVQRLMTKNGVLKIGRSGPFSKYTRADYILQFRFRSRVSMNEETIAVQAPDPTIYLAWQVVADFFSRVGDPMMNE